MGFGYKQKCKRNSESTDLVEIRLLHGLVQASLLLELDLLHHQHSKTHNEDYGVHDVRGDACMVS